jgi:hypothetical protein
LLVQSYPSGEHFETVSAKQVSAINVKERGGGPWPWLRHAGMGAGSIRGAPGHIWSSEDSAAGLGALGCSGGAAVSKERRNR